MTKVEKLIAEYKKKHALSIQKVDAIGTEVRWLRDGYPSDHYDTYEEAKYELKKQQALSQAYLQMVKALEDL